VMRRTSKPRAQDVEIDSIEVGVDANAETDRVEVDVDANREIDSFAADVDNTVSSATVSTTAQAASPAIATPLELGDVHADMHADVLDHAAEFALSEDSDFDEEVVRRILPAPDMPQVDNSPPHGALEPAAAPNRAELTGPPAEAAALGQLNSSSGIRSWVEKQLASSSSLEALAAEAHAASSKRAKSFPTCGTVDSTAAGGTSAGAGTSAPSALNPLHDDDDDSSLFQSDDEPPPDDETPAFQPDEPPPENEARVFQPNEPPPNEDTRAFQPEPDVPSWWWAGDETRASQPDEPPPDDETRSSGTRAPSATPEVRRQQDCQWSPSESTGRDSTSIGSVRAEDTH
jgi:hypothetical protein